MKLIVHVTKDNVSHDEATKLYLKLKKLLAFDKDIHVNGQALDKFEGSHNTGLPGPVGEI